MKQHGHRPVYLNLLKIRLPLGGVLSILHRISGVLLVLAVPVYVYFLQLLNGGENSFLQARELLNTVTGKILLSLVLWILIQHTLSGIRHLMMDLDYSYNKQTARRTAAAAFVCSALLIVLTGGLIWL